MTEFPKTWLGLCKYVMHTWHSTYFSFEFQEHFEIVVLSKSRVSSKASQEYFMHGNCLLECSKVFSANQALQEKLAKLS